MLLAFDFNLCWFLHLPSCMRHTLQGLCGLAYTLYNTVQHLCVNSAQASLHIWAFSHVLTFCFTQLCKEHCKWNNFSTHSLGLSRMLRQWVKYFGDSFRHALNPIFVNLPPEIIIIPKKDHKQLVQHGASEHGALGNSCFCRHLTITMNGHLGEVSLCLSHLYIPSSD